MIFRHTAWDQHNRQVLGIWRVLAKRRAEERHALRHKARDAQQMEFFEATRNITRAGRHTFRDPVQSSAFILEVSACFCISQEKVCTTKVDSSFRVYLLLLLSRVLSSLVGSTRTLLCCRPIPDIVYRAASCLLSIRFFLVLERCCHILIWNT